MTENEVASTNSIFLKQAVYDLLNELIHYNGVLRENKSGSELKEIINNKFVKICKHYLSIGQNELELLEREAFEIGEIAYLMHYRLPDFFKDIMLLHRDVLLQLQIGIHKHLEGVVSKKSHENHSVSSQNILLEAVEFFIQKFKEEEILAERLSERKKGIDSKVRHHQNPWNTYAKQFEILLYQFDSININDSIVDQSIRVFKELSTNTNEIAAMSVAESETIVNELKLSISNIEKIAGKEDINHIIHALEKTETSLDTLKNDQESFTQSIAITSNNLR
ncbi:hypothetical protein [Maribacter arcticus]|uniref:hypothetical protein n=1 Tax=Maribacter arcticus TaxID=561365 RepID=UPI00300205D5